MLAVLYALVLMLGLPFHTVDYDVNVAVIGSCRVWQFDPDESIDEDVVQRIVWSFEGGNLTDFDPTTNMAASCR